MSGFLRHREYERLKAEIERDMATLEQRKREWLGWYEENVSRYDKMAADLDQTRGTISLLAGELAVAQEKIRKQNRRARRPHGPGQQIIHLNFQAV